MRLGLRRSLRHESGFRQRVCRLSRGGSVTNRIRKIRTPHHLTPAPVRSIDDDLSAQLESLVRRIVAEGNSPLPQHIEMPASAFDGAAVVLGLEVDGVPYWLVQRPAPAVPATGRAWISLKPREREIVRSAAKGLPNKAIADVLDISL